MFLATSVLRIISSMASSKISCHCEMLQTGPSNKQRQTDCHTVGGSGHGFWQRASALKGKNRQRETDTAADRRYHITTFSDKPSQPCWLFMRGNRGNLALGLKEMSNVLRHGWLERNSWAWKWSYSNRRPQLLRWHSRFTACWSDSSWATVIHQTSYAAPTTS